MRFENKKINKIRDILKARGFDGYILTASDEFLNEYPPERNLRLKWLTNFSGSNGTILILQKKIVFFTDGRYTYQAKKQLSKCFLIFDSSKMNIYNWIKKNLANNKIVIDSKINSIRTTQMFESALFFSKNKIVINDSILMDQLWIDRPSEEIRNIYFLPIKYSGLSAKRKLLKVMNSIKKFDSYLITSPESIAWLLNLRGNDLLHTPIVFSRMLLEKNKRPKLFINLKKVNDKEKKIFKEIGIDLLSENKISSEIKSIKDTNRFALDMDSPYYFYNLIKGRKKNSFFNDPCKNLKAVKNKREIKGSVFAHKIDSIALIKFFYWLENQRFDNDFNEISVANKLEDFRRENKSFLSLSFPTISASGQNGAIIHYKASEKSNSILKKGNIYLCDSGGQYFSGTTDVTRTFFLGDDIPHDDYKDLYTRVLIGHINLVKLVFPINTRGVQIDSFARSSLWSIGEDYNHGTGHGVGSFLSVHEGPQSISKSIIDVGLKPGMIISNEPGIYKEKKFGIRIENLVFVKKSKNKNFLEFETLTLAPLEKKLINTNLMTKSQINWINDYHKKVYDNVHDYLDSNVKRWLKNKTSKI